MGNMEHQQHFWLCNCATLLLAGLFSMLFGSAKAQDYRNYDGGPQPYNEAPYGGEQYDERASYCARLEQRLAQNWVQGNSRNLNLPKLRNDIRKQDRIFHAAQAKAERANCYEYAFIFGKSLRRTPRCLRLHRQIEEARRSLTRLKERLDSSTNSQNRDQKRNQLIRALARNGCGSQYSREARKRSTNIFDSIFGGGDDYYNPRPRYDGRQSADFLPYATYRTMCVRKCDGYYYPVSYSALSSKFSDDASQCSSNCAAPAELFVYKNPGEAVEHMVSLNGEPYSALPNAWLYRKKFVKGCSCKQAEYEPADNDASSARVETP